MLDCVPSSDVFVLSLVVWLVLKVPVLKSLSKEMEPSQQLLAAHGQKVSLGGGSLLRASD